MFSQADFIDAPDIVLRIYVNILIVSSRIFLSFLSKKITHFFPISPFKTGLDTLGNVSGTYYGILIKRPTLEVIPTKCWSYLKYNLAFVTYALFQMKCQTKLQVITYFYFHPGGSFHTSRPMESLDHFCTKIYFRWTILARHLYEF